MMERSTREKQATIQENESKDEVKAETAEKAKSDEEKDEKKLSLNFITSDSKYFVHTIG